MPWQKTVSESKFVASTHQGRILISRAENSASHFVEFAPAEAAKASAIVGLILSTLSHKRMPEHITSSPFVVRIFPKGVFALERNDLGGSLPFRANEGDELIRMIDLGLGICLNEQTQGKVVPTGTTTSPGIPDAESF